jgi:peptidoglycan/LPS O-acetylase OafA/YrhL
MKTPANPNTEGEIRTLVTPAGHTDGKGRNIPLDVLRACAILLVLGRHMTVCPAETNGFLHRLTTVWQTGGWVGVDLFFVLSGFLVSGLLFREKIESSTLSIKRFLIRRGFKIYPSFWLLIGVTILVNWVFNIPTPSRRLASELLFVQNYVSPLWGHTWTLAVEEHFYLFLCLLLFALGGTEKFLRFRWLPGIFIGVAVLCLFSRWFTARIPPYGFWHAFIQTQSRIDSLMFGAVLSYWYHFGKPLPLLSQRPIRATLMGVGLLILALAFVFPMLPENWWMVVWALPVFAFGAGALILGGLHSRTLVKGPCRVLARIGFYSYSIYLWHMPIHHWLIVILEVKSGPGPNWWIYSAVYLCGSIGIGILMARLVEYPVLRIRDRLFPSPRSGRTLVSEAHGSGVDGGKSEMGERGR